MMTDKTHTNKQTTKKRVRKPFKKGPSWVPKKETLDRVPKEELEAAVSAKMTHEAMASKFKVTCETLAACARVHGVDLPSAIRAERRIVTPEREEKLRKALSTKPPSMNALCTLCKETETVIRAWMMTLGIEIDFSANNIARKERNEKIIALIRAGESNTSIAKMMHITKNTVAGVRARAIEAGELNLTSAIPGSRSEAVKRAYKRNPEIILARRKFNGTPVTKEKGPVPPTPPSPQREFANVIPFEKLKTGVCRFPVGKTRPYMFCGKPVEPGRSWCNECCAVCFEPEDVRRKKDRALGLRKSS